MRKIRILMLVLLSVVAVAVNATHFINTKAPGVKLVERDGQKVWVNSMGMTLANANESEPLENIDKYYYENVNRDNPDVKKVWDEERGCYIWKNGIGNFLGRDLGDKVIYDKYIERCDEYDLNGDPTSYQVQTKIVDPKGTTMQPIAPNVSSTEPFSIIGTWRTTKILSVAGLEINEEARAIMMTTVMTFQPNGKVISKQNGITQTYSYKLEGTSLTMDGIQSRLQVINPRKVQMTQRANGITISVMMEK